MELKELELKFLSMFRELFVYHHHSLEFRAKIFAAMISVEDEITDEIYEKVRGIGVDIYGRDEKRIEILVRTTKEYVDKVKTKNGLDIDQLIFDIDKILKGQKRFASKINIEHLKRLLNNENEDINIVQSRIIEFARSQRKQYLHID